MNTVGFRSGFLSLLTLAALPVTAANYADTAGDVIVPGSPFPHLDITSVVVNNDATTLTFKINLAGNPVATDWGKYLIAIDSVPAFGDPAGNGWARPIGLAAGMDYFVGSWVDSGNGSEIRNWTGAAWNLQSATYGPNPDNLAISKDTSSVTISFNFAGLGLGIGSSFFFDIYSSGGGGSDGAVDAAANPGPSIANWSDYYNSGPNVFSYTLQPIPEPSVAALLGLGAVLCLRRFRARA